MKTALLFTLLLWFISDLYSQVTHVVQVDGFAYSPATLTINTGDSVRFDGTASHPTLQVDQTTWNDNGTTPLEGGFDFPGGKGTAGFPDAGTYYYVCTAHVASQGMKGKIIVQAATEVKETSYENFSVFPVPLTGNVLSVSLQHSGNQDVALHIFDLAGGVLISTHRVLTGSLLQIDCSALPPGVYLLKVKSGGETLNKKFTRL